MKFKHAFLGALSLVASMAASAATLDLGSYILNYDDGTALGNPTASTGPGGAVSLSWSLGNAVSYLNVGPNPVVPVMVLLPTYSITAKPGFQLSGPLTGFAGNVIYAEFLGNTTVLELVGGMAIDGSVTGIDVLFDKTPIILVPGLTELGTFSLNPVVNVGNFASFGFAGNLILASVGTTGPSFGAIQSRARNELKVSFFATPVPVPPAAWLFSSALVGLVLRRRSAA